MQRKAEVISCLVVVLLLSSVLNGQTYLQRALKLKQTEGKVDLFGKVVDLEGNPVENAKVEYELCSYGFIKPHYEPGVILTDAEGLFSVHKEKGGILFIDDIECHGYEYMYGLMGKYNKVTSFDFRTSRRERHHADENAPVVFHLRKKTHPGTLLLQEGFDICFTTEQGEKWYACDLGKGAAVNRNTISIWEGCFWDFEATGELNLEKGEWTVRIKMNGEEACIQRLDTMLYEAPDEGYAREIVFSVPFSEEPPLKHFYARLRKPGVYARFDVARAYSRDNKLLISCDVFINPYGDRSLEQLLTLYDIKKFRDKYNRGGGEDRIFNQAVDKSGDLFLENEKKAKEAFRKQQLAPRPDFEKWIKEGLAVY